MIPSTEVAIVEMAFMASSKAYITCSSSRSTGTTSRLEGLHCKVLDLSNLVKPCILRLEQE